MTIEIFQVIKWVALSVVAPVMVIILGNLVLQNIMNRRHLSEIIASIKTDISGKVGYEYHNKSMKRVHDKIEDNSRDTHKRINGISEKVVTIAEDVSYIRGTIGRNGGVS